MKFVPRTYQQEALDHLDAGCDSLLFIEMGLGKTVTVLTHIAKLIKEDPSRRFLIIAPLRVIRYVWRQECAKWDHLRHLRIANAAVNLPFDRRLAIRSPEANIVLINYEKLPWLCDTYRELPFYGLVLDEIDKLKSPGTKRFRRFRGRAHQFKMRIGMTGTPTSESLVHIWGPTFLTTSQETPRGLTSALGKSDRAFKDRYFDTYGWNTVPKDGAMEDITRRIKPYVYSARSADHLDLPAVEVRDVLYDLPPKAMKHYEELEKQLVTFLAEDDPVAVANRGVLVNKLRQLCAGFVYDEGGDTRWIHHELQHTYDDMMSELQGPHVVVYGFRAELERFKFKHVLSSKLSASAEAKMVDRWNHGEISRLAMHPAAGGHGLNLQDSGAHHLVFLTLPWSRGMYDQTVARLHRMGQTNRVVIWRLLARGTVDERVVEALAGKGEVQNAVFAALRGGGG